MYSPTQDLEGEQIAFFHELYGDVENNLDKKTIIGGDFNICLEDIDRYNHKQQRTKARLEIQKMIEAYDLLDIWRIYNPDTKRFTWRRNHPLTQSRLDFWLIGSDLSYEIENCDIKPSIKTDHSLITLKLMSNSPQIKGRGLWKFNSNLLTDPDFIGYMKGMIILSSKNHNNIVNSSLKWEMIKMELRQATISYSKVQVSSNREHENKLISHLNELDMLSENEKTVDEKLLCF